MFTLRQRIFIFAGVGALLIIAAVLLLLAWNKSKKEAAAPLANEANVIDQGNFPTAPLGGQPSVDVSNLKAQAPTTEELEKNAAKQMAKIFIERYSSFSTDNGGQNIVEIKTLVTDALWDKLNKKSLSAESFVGVTTKVISANVASWTAGRATVNLQVIQTTEKNGAISTAHREVKVFAVKDGDNWLVEKFEWTQ